MSSVEEILAKVLEPDNDSIKTVTSHDSLISFI